MGGARVKEASCRGKCDNVVMHVMLERSIQFETHIARKGYGNPTSLDPRGQGSWVREGRWIDSENQGVVVRLMFEAVVNKHGSAFSLSKYNTRVVVYEYVVNAVGGVGGPQPGSEGRSSLEARLGAPVVHGGERSTPRPVMIGPVGAVERTRTFFSVERVVGCVEVTGYHDTPPRVPGLKEGDNVLNTPHDRGPTSVWCRVRRWRGEVRVDHEEGGVSVVQD